MRERETLNFRIKTDLKKQFIAMIKQKGFSTCFILETLIQAWLIAAPAPQKEHPGSIIINQHIDYNVKKSRRTLSGPPDNCYEKKNGVWLYRKPDSKTDLNSRSHHISCECRDCSVSILRNRRSIEMSIEAETAH